MLPVLVIDDNDAVCAALQVLFDIHGLPCQTASSPQEGLALVRKQRFGAVIQDMNFTEDNVSGEEGVRLFRALRREDPFLPILLITAWTSLETAVRLVKEGAHDYLGKPWDDRKLVEEVTHLLKREGSADRAEMEDADLCGLVHADPKMAAVVTTALQVARADVPVLITGPNGAGKEMIAKIIRANSLRAKLPFVTVNAGALPNELLESELFGAEAGAYTGARQSRIGRFEEAHRGTLFLDEIANLSLTGQVKLLRVLQTGEYSRLGSNRVALADVRVISATNADLAAAIAAGTFREDLYFRLNVVEIAVPPLAQRPGDIMPLARHFLANLPGAAGKSLSPALEPALRAHPWPGNVRELQNRLQRAVLVASGTILDPHDLGLDKSLAAAIPLAAAGDEDLDERDERRQIEAALHAANGNVSQAARLAKRNRTDFYKLLARHDLNPDAFKPR